MRGRSAIILGLLNVCLMSAAYFFGFSAGKEHESYLRALEQVNVQIRYPIERLDTARLDDLSNYNFQKKTSAK